MQPLQGIPKRELVSKIIQKIYGKTPTKEPWNSVSFDIFLQGPYKAWLVTTPLETPSEGLFSSYSE